MEYADILLPIALHPLTYHVGDEQLCEGMAVMVGIGPRKICQGIVWRLHNEPPRFRTKPVERVLYGRPLLDKRQMEFWEWIAEYYMCSLGEVMAAAIPSQLKPEGLSAEEFARDEFRPAISRFICLHPSIDSLEKLNEALETFARARSQYKAFLEIVDQLRHSDDIFKAGLPRESVKANSVILKKLLAKEFIIIEERHASDNYDPLSSTVLPTLTEEQLQALGSIKESMAAKSTVLLHGVTGSGKTEIFINLAADVMQSGRSVLYLLPEIPISWQLIGRLSEVFGQRLVAYHSKFTPRQRAEIFMRVSYEDSPAQLIIGTRTAIFLPMRNLGLIIVDEEHDTSFKQDSPAPRFHARDCALMLASLHGAATVLGSATPSIESYYNALSGKYALVALTKRYGGVPMPRILLSDSLQAAKRSERDSHFNKLFISKLDKTLSESSQAIVFQNRRGFSPYVECGGCAWIASCPNCNVTLTLHKSQNRLRCHYCGHNVATPRVCPACRQGELLPKGYGTEKVSDELQRIFPEAKIERLDSDTASSSKNTRRIINDFEQGHTDILVGTQMVTKGFDFKNVKLVGVVNADLLLNYPDFRASERAFQMLTQAAGRAGRREEQGEVVIQSTQISHPVLRQVEAGDYDAMVRTQLAERRSFFYPPFCRIISIRLKSSDKALLKNAANSLASSLRPLFGTRLLGPESPAVDRVMREHILIMILKIERAKSFSKAKRLLREQIEIMKNNPDYKKVTLTCNVDPQ